MGQQVAVREPERVCASGRALPSVRESNDPPAVVGFAPAANPRTGSARGPCRRLPALDQPAPGAEKPAAGPGVQRPKVAAIIYNRLASDMTTGMESGIQYALGSWEPLTRDDLDTDSPYNL